MVICCECGLPAVTTREDIPLEALPSAVIQDAYVYTCKNGHREIGIPQLAQILRWIALRLIEKRSQLTGAEIRYLRKHLGFAAKEFAEFMSVKPETVSRWEGGTLSMSMAHEKNLRIAVRSGLDVLQYEIKPTRKARPMPLAVSAQLVA